MIHRLSFPRPLNGRAGSWLAFAGATICAWVVPGAVATLSAAPATKDEFQLLDRWLIWSDSGTMVMRHLTNQAMPLLDQREANIAKLRSREDWLARQNHVRGALDGIIGTFSQNSPLNPQVTGVVRKNGYRIEKIVFESLPRLYVTGCLLIPDGLTSPAPTILYTAGSNPSAFRGEQYQQHILNLVRLGYVVFAIDPIGQGERPQYYDPATGKSPVSEFNYPVHQCFLTGFTYARFYIRDAMRAIDYLQTRREVDPRRIGMGGLSWGGWQCTIVSALDPRIVAAASAAGINETYRRLLQSKGVGSAGKYPVGFIAAGLDKPDFFTLIAPRAFMRVSTTRDYKPIQGARESYAQYRRAFEALGAADKLDFTEDDFGHGYTPKNNEAIYRFYGKHLAHPGPSAFVPMEMMSEEDTRITPTGKVATSLKGAIAFDFYREEAVRLLAAIDLSRQSPAKHLRAVPLDAARLAGVELPTGETAPVFLGRHQRQGHKVEMYVLQGEAGYVIPMLLFVPNDSPTRRTIIYIHPQGKSEAANAGGDVARLVQSGYVVAVPDLAGSGETRTTWGDSGTLQSLAGMMNRSLVGLQAGDIMRVRAFLMANQDHQGARIWAIAVGSLGPALLHAAVLDQSIAALVLVDAPLSYRAAVMNRRYKLDVSAMVPKALTAYDLPDLVAAVAPRRVAFINPRDHLLEPANAPGWEQELAFSRAAYEHANVGSNLTVTGSDGNLDQMIKWALE